MREKPTLMKITLLDPNATVHVLLSVKVWSRIYRSLYTCIVLGLWYEQQEFR